MRPHPAFCLACRRVSHAARPTVDGPNPARARAWPCVRVRVSPSVFSCQAMPAYRYTRRPLAGHRQATARHAPIGTLAEPCRAHHAHTMHGPPIGTLAEPCPPTCRPPPGTRQDARQTAQDARQDARQTTAQPLKRTIHYLSTIACRPHSAWLSGHREKRKAEQFHIFALSGVAE